jgi:hypothetical protein
MKTTFNGRVAAGADEKESNRQGVRKRPQMVLHKDLK